MTSYLRAWQSLPQGQLALVLLLAAAVVLANINQPYPQIALLQHIPTALLILATPPLLRRFRNARYEGTTKPPGFHPKIA